MFPRTIRIAWLASLLFVAPGGRAAGVDTLPDEVKDVRVEPWNPVRGPADADVTLVVFGEYLCPFSQRLEATLDRLVEAYGDRVRIVHRNYIVHPPAEHLAEAALAAALQDRFREMHALLFENQRQLGEDTSAVDDPAQRAGLDLERFHEDLESDLVHRRLEADIAEGRRLGVTGTPTVFVNGRMAVGYRTAARLGAWIDELLGIPTPTIPAEAEAAGAAGGAGRGAGEGGAPPPAPRARRPREDPDAVYRVPVGRSPTLGPADALVTIVVFSDFECPFCGRVTPVLQGILDEHVDDVRVAFKNLPLESIHRHARLAAEAALAAHAQGRFWEYHDALFRHGDALERADLESYAEDLGLDLRAFRRALERHAHAAAIDDDVALARSLNVTGTPTFLVNGRKVVGAAEERLRELVAAELERAGRLVDEGTAREDVYDAIMEDASPTAVFLPSEEDAGAPPAARGAARPDPEAVVDVGVEPWNPARGPATAPVTIVVFGEYLCPFCQRLEGTLDELVAAYGDRIRIVHRSFIVHPTAEAAARAALAAALQGRFPEMHDALFANYELLRGDGLRSDPQMVLEVVATQAGVDPEQMSTDMAGRLVRERLDADIAEAQRVGVTGTPTAFVNGHRVSGAQPAGAFGEWVDRALGLATPTFP
jgi:protein-disulfide isomerase